MPARTVTPRLVGELRRTLYAHPGDVPVRLLVKGPARNVLYELGPAVNPETGFASEIKTLLGPGCWA